MRAVVGVVGAILTLLVLADLVAAMLVPRGSRAPIGRATLALVTTAYRRAARLPRTYAGQHRLLAAAAPVALLVQLVVYVTILILTMGMVVYGLSPLDASTSLYQSGSTLTTLGIVAPVTAASAIATFLAAFLGLVAIAVFIGYLLALYSAFTARESLMARLSLIAGEPAWGPAAFARAHALDLAPEAVLDADRWTDWMCDVRTNITVSPILAWFRSTTPMRHWTISLLAVLDIAALRLAAGIGATRNSDLIAVSEGIICVRVVTGSRGDTNLPQELDVLAALERASTSSGSGFPSGSGLDDTTWREGADLLRHAGIIDDSSEARVRARFLALRALYAPELIALATRLHAVPAPWSGSRVPDVAVITPDLPSEVRA